MLIFCAASWGEVPGGLRGSRAGVVFLLILLFNSTLTRLWMLCNKALRDVLLGNSETLSEHW